MYGFTQNFQPTRGRGQIGPESADAACASPCPSIADDAIESSKSKPGDRETAAARMISMIVLVQ